MLTLTDTPARHYYSAEQIMAALDLAEPDTAGRSRVDVIVSATQSAWHPASSPTTARRITGPVCLRYVQWPDGGIDVAETTGAQLSRVR